MLEAFAGLGCFIEEEVREREGVASSSLGGTVSAAVVAAGGESGAGDEKMDDVL